jgi:hypothetical protein
MSSKSDPATVLIGSRLPATSSATPLTATVATVADAGCARADREMHLTVPRDARQQDTPLPPTAFAKRATEAIVEALKAVASR